jgi:uncharacterized protein (TIGR03083 family)
MKKTELLERVRASQEKLTTALDGLSEEQATRAGLTPQWSIKDALAHIVAWELEGARIIGEIQQGTWKPQKFDKQMIDDFNAHASEERKNLTMEQVRAEFNSAHRKMEDTLAAMPDEIDESSPAYKYAEGVTFRHHAHHAAQIEEFKKGMGIRG